MPDDQTERLKAELAAARQQNRQAREEIDRLKQVNEYVAVARKAHEAEGLPADLGDVPGRGWAEEGLSIEEASEKAVTLAKATKEWADEQVAIAVDRAVAQVHRENCTPKKVHPFGELTKQSGSRNGITRR